MKKMLFIMNPFAGKRKANRHLADILTIFNRADYDVTVYMTAGPGDATAYAEKCAAQFDIIVCCGGDGTAAVRKSPWAIFRQALPTISHPV